MAVKVNGKIFTGVTYNQGPFGGDRGHIFINGRIQCSCSLNLHASNRIWLEIRLVKDLVDLVKQGSTCKICAKKTKTLINAAEEES
jgi:hypothetical protein